MKIFLHPFEPKATARAAPPAPNRITVLPFISTVFVADLEQNPVHRYCLNYLPWSHIIVFTAPNWRAIGVSLSKWDTLPCMVW